MWFNVVQVGRNRAKSYCLVRATRNLQDVDGELVLTRQLSKIVGQYRGKIK